VHKLEQRDREDLLAILDKPHGLRFIARLLDYCGMYMSLFNSDIGIMAFNAGKRDVGLMLLSMIQNESSEVDYVKSLHDATSYRLQLYKEDEKERMKDASKNVLEKVEARRRINRRPR